MLRYSWLRPLSFAVAFAIITFPDTSGAQTPTPDFASRISFAAGVGGGKLTQDCVFDACPVAFASERTWMARIGYREEQTVIGLEYDNWRRVRTVNGNKISETYTWIGPSAQWYPFTSSSLRGLHVQALLALATFSANPAPTGLRSIGYGGGVAFDVPIVNALVLTPYVEMLGATRAEKNERIIGRDGRPTTTKVWYSARMTSFGVAVRWNGIP